MSGDSPAPSGDSGGLALPRSFYERPTIDVARDLLGCALHHGDRSGVIVEAEAYVGRDDLACHAARGNPSGRTAVMYGPAGYAYVYLIYGMYNCFNVVTESAGFPAAVLVRALEPLGELPGPTNGPGRLGRALGIDRTHSGLPLDRPPLWISARVGPELSIAVGHRIGVAYAGEWAEKPWRFWVESSRYVSSTRT